MRAPCQADARVPRAEGPLTERGTNCWMSGLEHQEKRGEAKDTGETETLKAGTALNPHTTVLWAGLCFLGLPWARIARS